jgi:hypothetical protein
MPLLLPNLDDRTWADLADEGRSLIPVYGPEWTDHNASDPGITVIELLAWITEMDLYRLNQVTDAERLRFLALAGVRPRGPKSASAVLSFSVGSGTPTLPASLEFSRVGADKTEIRYQTTRQIVLAPGSLVALQSTTSNTQNLTPTWKRGLQVLPFGADPQIGSAFYLGLSDALPVNSPVSFYFTFGDQSSDIGTREEILREADACRRACKSNLENPCCEPGPGEHPHSHKKTSDDELIHYGVRTVWEYLTASGTTTQWKQLQPDQKEVVDETRSFTLDGPITFRVPAQMASLRFGSVSNPLYYLRCRIDAGRYDAPPALSDVGFNAVRAVQRVPATSSFVVDSKCTITYAPGGPPKPMDRSALRFQFDSQERIIRLDFTNKEKSDPEFTVLDFKPPATSADGYLTIEAIFLGYGSGLPAQQCTLPAAPVEKGTVHVCTQETNFWHDWEIREDFFASTRRDQHATLDPSSGTLTFGNGEHGRVPPQRIKQSSGAEECLIFATCETTRAQDGNLAARQINSLSDSPHNRALLSDGGANPNGWNQLALQLTQISNRLAANGGSPAETVDLAAGRADKLIETTSRAVTVEDYEHLALSTPGTRIARVKAWANLHPDFPCYKAPGMITVIVLPFLPQGRPVPTLGLLQAVAAYLRPRRVLGTRVEVVGPTYLQVSVNAGLQSKRGVDKTAVQQSAVEALNQFLDPLKGGPEGTGWPFGRDVYRAEILRILSEVSGVDCVTSLELVPAEGPAQCGNLCVGPTWLTIAGTHQVQVS